MPKIHYIIRKFKPSSRRIIGKANQILESYADQGIRITLRSLYYQFVALGWLPNRQQSYKRLGKILGDARLAGYVDWSHLNDRMRYLNAWEHFDSPQAAVQSMLNTYNVDMWKHQKYRPEVWIEKDALVGVIEKVCAENNVPFFACRGYTSLSEMWRASLRLRRHAEEGYTPYIIHFGDHDPSGIDMSRDIVARLQDTFRADLDFKRVALNMNQIEELKPFPNPAKVTDSRYKAYIEKYGTKSWELDALPPTMFADMIQERLDAIVDKPQWDKDQEEVNKVRGQMVEIAKDWDNIPTMRQNLKDLTDNIIERDRLIEEARSEREELRTKLKTAQTSLREIQRKGKGRA